MRTITRAIIVALALTLVVAACGDDDTATEATSTAAATASTAPAATESTAAPSTTAVAPSDATDLTDLQARYESTPLRLTYLIEPGPDQTEVVLAQDPTVTPTVESITLVGGDTKIIITGDTTVLCDSGACFEVPGAAGQNLTTGLLGPFGALLALGPEGPLGASASEEPIDLGGRSGVCYTYTPTAEVGTEFDLLRQCIDGELGFTLLLQSSETGSDELTTILELTDFATPTPEDFEPTGPITPTP